MRFLLAFIIACAMHTILFTLPLPAPEVEEILLSGRQSIPINIEANEQQSPERAESPPLPPATEQYADSLPEPVVDQPVEMTPPDPSPQIPPPTLKPARKKSIYKINQSRSPVVKKEMPSTIEKPIPTQPRSTAQPSTPPPPAATQIESEKQLKFRYNPQPVYPKLARKRGWHGTVLLAVVITPAGKVQSVIILRSSGHALLDKAALKTVRRWEFEQEGSTSPREVTIPIRFTLE